MKKHPIPLPSVAILSQLLLFVLLAAPASAQNNTQNVGRDTRFQATTPSGHLLSYAVVDDGQVNIVFHAEYPELLGGDIEVPRSVKHNGTNYIVTGIADGAFANCIRVKSVTLPTTLYSIGDRAFLRCTALRIIRLPKTLTTIGARAFEGCTALIDVVLPNAVSEIGEYVFSGCCNVRHFVLSHALTAIPDGAFENCTALTDILIPEQVATISCTAFKGYKALSLIVLLNTTPPVPGCEEPFGREITVRVPARAFDIYKASTAWGQYNLQSL